MTEREFETAYRAYLKNGGDQPNRGNLSIGSALKIIEKIRRAEAYKAAQRDAGFIHD